MTKIYVSGSSGMVGRNVAETLAMNGYDVLRTRSSELNLLNFEDVKKFLLDNKPDFVVHCAGKVGGIQANMKDCYGFFTENILMGVNLVKAAKEAEIKNFINLSSSCAYPVDAPNPLKEEYFFTGRMETTNEGYAIAKTSVLKMCEFLNRQFEDYHYKTVVPCNLYGKYDKYGENNSHMIPAVIKKIHNAKVQNAPSVEIWGKGEVRRESLSASDVALLINYCIKNFEKMPPVLNAGSGIDYTINEYYEIIADVIGYKGEFTHDLTKPEGVKKKLLDVTKLKEFGWKPKYSLKEGVEETYKYYAEVELKK